MGDRGAPPTAIDAQERQARHVPYDVSLEQAILGSFFLEPETVADAQAVIAPAHFYDPLHQALCELIFEFSTQGKPITPLTLQSWTKHWPAMQEVGGHAYLAGLLQAAPALPSMKQLCADLRDLWVRRCLIAYADDVSDAAYSGPRQMPALAQVEQAAEAISQIAEVSLANDGAEDAADAGQTLLRATEQQLMEGRPVGCTTGVRALDDVLGALIPGNLIIVAGRPGMGKTMTGTNFARAAASEGWLVDYWSLEMPRGQISARLQADIDYERAIEEGRRPLDYSRVIQGRPSKGDLRYATEANVVLRRLGINILDPESVTAQRMFAVSRARARRSSKRRIIIVDHGGLVEPDNRYSGRKVDEISEQTKLYKRMAKALNVPIIVLWQLSREIEGREDKRPILKDLRDSGSIEQDADVVIFVYRALYYAQEAIRRAKNEEQLTKAQADYDAAVGKLEFIVAKNRNGCCDAVTCHVEPICGSIRDERPYPKSVREANQAALDLVR